MNKNIALLLAAGVFTAACGSDDAKDALGISSGQDAGPIEVQVAADAGSIGEVPDEQKQALCDTVTNAANDGVSFYKKCNFGALLAAAAKAAQGLEAVRAACSDALDTCHTVVDSGGGAAEGAVPEISLPGCALFKGDTSTCTEPVDTLNTCLTDIAKAAAETVSKIDCATLTVDGAVDQAKSLGSAVPDTPACGELQLKCPGVFGGGGGGEGGSGGGGGEGGSGGEDVCAASGLDFASGDATAGEQVYTDFCATCHGPDGMGLPDAPTPGTKGIDLHDEIAEPLPDDCWVQVIKNGEGDMAPVGGITDQNILDVLAYMKANFGH